MSVNFELAPPPKTVDGLLAVPIDISAIQASIVFDCALQIAQADATITYELGPQGGHPFFDLRQSPSEVWLDGSPLAPDQVAHHDFGSGAFTNLRVLALAQAAGSVHSLRLRYTLALPDAQLGGAYLPALDWLAGPRLRFVLGLSDLNRARYLEAWLPANLPFDQYSIALEVQITGTPVAHSPITNASITNLGSNHWQLDFPARFSALSPMLELRASDSLEQHTANTVLPVSGNNVAIETWKPAGSAINLVTQAGIIASLLAANETAVGPYLHGNRFVAFFNGGGMEYEGATTTSTSALAHEVFHSWFARGIKPAAQADGWWDEGITEFHDAGANDTEPFDYSDPPVLLCSRDPWQRHTPGNAYADGARFWRGMAAMLGVAPFNNLMAQCYAAYQGGVLSTAEIEAFLLARSGKAEVVDAFHRFVYNLDDSASPDLWLRDEVGDPGNNFWGGSFWNSPDLWIRNADDGGLSHQSPEYGQDNWFYARVRNRSASASARHFVLSFHARGFAGTQFSWPADFLPAIAARAEFDLAPGSSRIVKARWPAAQVPPAGSHTCLLAAAVCRGEHPAPGAHVWEHNNLAQKNLSVVDMVPGEYFVLPVVIAQNLIGLRGLFDIEVWRRDAGQALTLGLIHRHTNFFRLHRGAKPKPFEPTHHAPPRHGTLLDCGGHVADQGRQDGHALISSKHPEQLALHFGEAWHIALPAQERARLGVDLSGGQQRLGLLVQVPKSAQAEAIHRIELVQRHRKSGQIVGGVSLEIRLRSAHAQPPRAG